LSHYQSMKPKLLVIVGRFVVGGHATDNIPLLYHLKEKYTVRMIYGEKEADEIEPLFLLDQFPGLDVVKLPVLKRSINPFADISTLFTIYKQMVLFKPDIVHTHGAKAGFTGRLAAWFYGKCVVVHTFHGHLFHSYFNKVVTNLIIAIERTMAKITDAAIALSATQKKELVSQFKIFPERKVYQIPLGLFEPREQAVEKGQLRDKYKLKDNDVAIGIIGRIVPIKNHLDFLKAAGQILQRGYENVHFFVIGDGEERQVLTDFLALNGISFSLPGHYNPEAKVIFTSWIANMYEVIYDLDAVVLTSLNEGTPVSLIEAQLCSKPVVAYNVGGVKDTFANGKSGYLIAKGDVEELTNKLAVLIDNPGDRAAMGVEGKAFATSHFSKDVEVAAIDKMYQTLLKNKLPKQL
jgi:glycosyltransferase involved in cell wall biosynthesis